MAATNEQQPRPLTQTMGGDPAYQKTVMQTMMRALGDSNVKLELGEDDTLKTTYKPMLENIQAQTQATEQAGLPSYEGIDPELVLGLMKQRAVQDQQFRQQPLDMSQMAYQNALAGQAQAQPQMKLMDMAMRMRQNIANNQATIDAARIKAKGSPMDQLEFAGMFNLYKKDPEAAMIAMNPSLKPEQKAAKVQYVDQLKDSGMFTDKEVFTIVYTPNLIPEALAARIHEAQLRGGMGYEPAPKVGAYQTDLTSELTPPPVPLAPAGEMSSRRYQDAQGTQFKNPEVSDIARSLLGGPNPNIIPAPDRAATLSAGVDAEAARIRSEGTIPKNLMVKDAKTALGPVISVDKSGNWARIKAPNGEEFIVSSRK